MITSTDKESKQDKKDLEKQLKHKFKELKILQGYEKKFKAAEKKAETELDPKGSIHNFIVEQLKEYLGHISENKSDYRRLGTATALLVDYLELENDKDEAILALNYLDNPMLTGTAVENAAYKLMLKLAKDNFNKAEKDIKNIKEENEERLAKLKEEKENLEKEKNELEKEKNKLEQPTSTTQTNIEAKKAGKENKIENISFSKDGFEGSFLENYEFLSEGSESVVYKSKDGTHVIKISEPYSSNEDGLFERRIAAMLLKDIVGNSGFLKVFAIPVPISFQKFAISYLL
jgi:DNA gyrase/topoisomerase IV subunit A